MKSQAINRAALLAHISLAVLFASAEQGVAFAAPFDGAPSNDPYIVQRQERMAEIVDQSNAIIAKSNTEKRDLTEEENNEVDDLQDEFDNLKNEIARRERVAASARHVDEPSPRRTSARGAPREDEEIDDEDSIRNNGRRPANGSAARTHLRAARSPTHGFENAGEFFAAVQIASSSRNTRVDERLMAAAASTVSTESAGADGGFAVPPDYSKTILERVYSEDSLLQRTDKQTSASNTMTLPTDNTTPWQASGGIQAYWEGEAAAIGQSKVSLENVTMRLHKLAALVPVTEELLEDAPSLGNYVNRKAPEKMDFKISYAIAWGNGVGMPLGFMNSPSLVTVAAEGGQTADTINATNVSKMYSRMPASLRKNGVWLIHPDAEPQLDLMTVGQYPVYLPPGGYADAPFGRLRGRPVIPHEICETVGDLGDIMFVSLDQYLSISKTAGVKAQQSIHLWFDQDITAFKFTFRLAGQSWWSGAINPRDGANTRSPFITLAAR